MNFYKLFQGSVIMKIYKTYLFYKYKLLYHLSPRKAADVIYYKTFVKHINWENPQNLNEKIRWLLLNSDTTLWSICADKYKVREYVIKKGCPEILVELYGVWDKPEDVEFESLPNEFVLKSNNGCGTVKIVKNKNALDYKKVIKEMRTWVSRPFGYMGAQVHYLAIQPRIIAERLLIGDECQRLISPESLIDYKVWCINGIPECILVIFGREGLQYYRQVYDINWEPMPHVLAKSTRHSLYTDIQIPKPECLDKLLEYARILSEDFPEVRVDFYIIDKQPIFGELTFSAGMGTLSDEYYNYLGSKIDLSKYQTK